MKDKGVCLIPVLPVLLEHKLDHKIWSWFTNDACLESAEYEYDTAKDKIISSDDQMTADILKDWDDNSLSDHENDEDFDNNKRLPKMNLQMNLVLEPGTHNEYGNNGTVKTFGKECTDPSATRPPDTKIYTAPDTDTDTTSSLTGSVDTLMRQMVTAMQDDDSILSKLSELMLEHKQKKAKLNPTDASPPTKDGVGKNG